MSYKKYFNTFWIPILQRQYFKYMLMKDKEAIEELEKNVRNNWNLTKNDKIEFLKIIKGKRG